MGRISKTNYIWLIAFLALAVAAAFLLVAYSGSKSLNSRLEEELKVLSEKEKRSVIVQSISAQMEEIAYQQKAVSDEQREEALQQTRIANQMRRQSEIERQNAIEAQRSALASEQKAIEASRQAENERLVAEARRAEAEQARAVADTLGYLALSRSLASAASLQENAGNHELSSLLAYASYIFTKRYNGDLYQPVLFEALSLTSRSSQTWPVHNGSIMKFGWVGSGDSLAYSISTYGELAMHRVENDKLSSKILFSNNNFDFRDIVIQEDGSAYAVSRSGELLCMDASGKIRLQVLEGIVHPFRVFSFTDGQLLVVAENKTIILDLASMRAIKTISYSKPVSIAGIGEKENLLLFGEDSQMLDLFSGKSPYDIVGLPFKEKVFSYTWMKEAGISVFGTTDGVINLVHPSGGLVSLVGHRSRVSRLVNLLRIAGDRGRNILFSTSYDGTVKMWDLNKEKWEPVTVLASDSWVVSCAFDSACENIWTGDQNGNLTRTLISIPKMARRLKMSLTRDFTREEWAYYVGENVPYETFKDR